MPPPLAEVPLVYAGKGSGKRNLTDEQVIEARLLAKTASINSLSKKYGVAYKTMYSAVKGLSYKHLNADHPPQL